MTGHDVLAGVLIGLGVAFVFVFGLIVGKYFD